MKKIFARSGSARVGGGFPSRSLTGPKARTRQFNNPYSIISLGKVNMNLNRNSHPLYLVAFCVILIISMFGCKTANTTSSTQESPQEQTQVTNLPSESPISDNNLMSIPLSIGLFGFQNIGSSDGWNRFYGQLSLKNIGNEYLTLVYVSETQWEITPSGSKIDTSQSFVETSEDSTYPAAVTLYNTEDYFTIPAGISISPSASYPFRPARFYSTFEIPELLNATRLVISPGYMQANGQSEPYYIDLSDESVQEPMTLNNITAEELPIDFPISDSVVAHIDYSTVIPQVRYEKTSTSEFGGGFDFALDITIKNNDITSNQPISLELIIIDKLGNYYHRTRFGFPEYGTCTDTLPESIGPNQTISSTICFTVSESAANVSRDFYLVTNRTATYYIKFPTITNCFESGEIRNFDEPTIDEQQVNIPVSLSNKFEPNTAGAHIIRFIGIAGKSIEIIVTPDVGGDGLELYLFDPSGAPIEGDTLGDIEEFFSISFQDSPNQYNILCNGQYSIYIIMNTNSAPETNYNVSIKYID